MLAMKCKVRRKVCFNIHTQTHMWLNKTKVDLHFVRFVSLFFSLFFGQISDEIFPHFGMKVGKNTHMITQVKRFYLKSYCLNLMSYEWMNVRVQKASE